MFKKLFVFRRVGGTSAEPGMTHDTNACQTFYQKRTNDNPIKPSTANIQGMQVHVRGKHNLSARHPIATAKKCLDEYGDTSQSPPFCG
mmetsp:Transcript_52697/g.94072  ORF Transcript_52697/g.94072 Transcript_52697/m.94072 type:complete len:88 (-) Transcript_52697:145-408(-)